MSDDLQRAASGRAANMETFRELLNRVFTAEGVCAGLELKLRPTDIVITPFGKSGTTWLQQIAHTLRTGGDMDFDDISRVAPWIESSTDLGLDLTAEQKANPRLFKSHMSANDVPKGGRYMISCRDPKDVVYSMFKFMEGWFIEPGAVSLDDFANASAISIGLNLKARGDYWAHLHSWWLRRNDPDVLFLAYEHMKHDLTGTIRKVAAFMDIPLDDQLLAVTEKHASLAFMQEHKDRFDDKLLRDRGVLVAGLPTDCDSSKVRVGKVGESRQQLSPETAAKMDAIWKQRITAELGFESYAEMIATL